MIIVVISFCASAYVSDVQLPTSYPQYSCLQIKVCHNVMIGCHYDTIYLNVLPMSTKNQYIPEKQSFFPNLFVI